MTKLNKWEMEIENIYQRELNNTGTKMSKSYADMLKRFKKEGRDVLADPSNLTRTEKYNAQRKAALEKRIMAIARETNPEIRAATKELVEKSGKLGYYGTQYTLEKAAKTTIAMQAITPRYLNAVITDKVDGKRFSERLYSDREKMARLVSREMVKAAEDGIGYRQLAARLEAVTQNDMNHSYLIARTEAKRTRSEMHQEAYNEAMNAGVQLEKEWLHSGNGTNPRNHHEEMNGVRVPADENFETPLGNSGPGPGLFGVPEEDIQCGCWTVTHVVSIQPTGQEFEVKSNWQEWAKEHDVEV